MGNFSRPYVNHPAYIEGLRRAEIVGELREMSRQLDRMNRGLEESWRPLPDRPSLWVRLLMRIG